jgi:tetratricopeptide (TPR) repeat protein
MVSTASRAFADGLSAIGADPTAAPAKFEEAATAYSRLAALDPDTPWDYLSTYSRAMVALAHGRVQTTLLNPMAARTKYQQALSVLEKLASTDPAPGPWAAVLPSEIAMARAQYHSANYRYAASRQDWSRAAVEIERVCELRKAQLEKLPDDAPPFLRDGVSTQLDRERISAALAHAEDHRQRREWDEAKRAAGHARELIEQAAYAVLETSLPGAEVMQEALLNWAVQMDVVADQLDRERALHEELRMEKEELARLQRELLEKLGATAGVDVQDGELPRNEITVNLMNSVSQNTEIVVKLEERARSVIEELENATATSDLPEAVQTQILEKTADALGSTDHGPTFLDRVKKLSGEIGAILANASAGAGDVARIAHELLGLASLAM